MVAHKNPFEQCNVILYGRRNRSSLYKMYGVQSQYQTTFGFTIANTARYTRRGRSRNKHLYAHSTVMYRHTHNIRFAQLHPYDILFCSALYVRVEFCTVVPHQSLVYFAFCSILLFVSPLRIKCVWYMKKYSTLSVYSYLYI